MFEVMKFASRFAISQSHGLAQIFLEFWFLQGLLQLLLLLCRLAMSICHRLEQHELLTVGVLGLFEVHARSAQVLPTLLPGHQ